MHRNSITHQLVALLAASSCACSFLYVSGPPSEPSERTHEAASRCTTSVLVPVFDSLGAAVGGINIAIAKSASPGKVAWYGIEMESKTGVALGATQLAVWGAGAVYGFVQTSRCNALRDEVKDAPEADFDAPPKWSPALAASPPTPPAKRAAPAPPLTPASAPSSPPSPPPLAKPIPKPADNAAAPASSSQVPTKSFPDP